MNFPTATDSYFSKILSCPPQAYACVRGNPDHPELSGVVKFYPLGIGVLVTADFSGLPNDAAPCAVNIFAMHIHQTGDCSGNHEDCFANVGGHYNPGNCPHPAHAGDLLPLMASDGFAWYAFSTTRFSIEEIINRAVIVHAKPDDFTTQPSGNSGAKIGCGVIRRVGC